MRRTAIWLYGLACYVIFLGTFAYMIGFIADLGVPKSIDSGSAGASVPALALDVLLLVLFAVQHSVMARPAFKRWLRRIVPQTAERSTFVLASSLALIVLVWQWRALPATVWDVSGDPAGRLLWVACALGWATVLSSTFMISHAHFLGLAQAWAGLRGEPVPEPRFQTRWLYRYVRHPLMFGFFVVFWATPRMTVGHLLFAAASTGYIVLATLAFEERDLERYLGEPYRRYRRTVPAFIPHLGRGVRTEDFFPGSDEAMAAGHARSTE